MSFPPQPPHDAPPPGSGGGFGPPWGSGPPPSGADGFGHPPGAGGRLPALPPSGPVGPAPALPPGALPGASGPQPVAPDGGQPPAFPGFPPAPPGCQPPGGGRGPKAVAVAIGAVVVAALVVGAGAMLAGGGQRASGAAPHPVESAPVPSTQPAGQAAQAASGPPGGQPVPSRSGLPYVKLTPGTCFDVPALDSRVTAVTIRPCRGPHDGEAISQETLGGTFADDRQLRAQALALCAPDVRERLRSIPRDGREYYYSYAIYPALETYQAEGEKTVTCSLTLSDTVDGRQLTAPLP